MRSRVKDIAFSPPFLRCCPSSLSSPCRVWTPANTEKPVSEAIGCSGITGPQMTSVNWARDSLQGRTLTFLAAEDARSGFTDSAFSLLEDLDLLLFSFSTESGESHEGLELLLFLKESGETGGAGLAACAAAKPAAVVGSGRTGSVLVLLPLGFRAQVALVDGVILERKRRKRRYWSRADGRQQWEEEEDGSAEPVCGVYWLFSALCDPSLPSSL